jgi:mono/diheme cytochrome c family protein
MSKYFLIGILAISGIAIYILACNENSAGTPGLAAVRDSAWFVKRGKYIVNSVGCDDCHSPKRMGEHGPEIIPELRFSGFPHDGKLPPLDTNQVKNGWVMMSPDLTSAVGPWGASFAGNISSDYTGIGNWTEENFLTAIRKGKLKGLEGSRDLLPPMPWFVYKNMTDEDLKAIFAYLKTTKPVENVVPRPKQLSELE